jgi:hypothetical protein
MSYWENLTINHIWDSFTEEERAQACEAVWDKSISISDISKSLRNDLANVMRFSPQGIAKMPVKSKGDHLKRKIGLPEMSHNKRFIIRAFILIHCKDMVDNFVAKLPMADEDKSHDMWFFPTAEIPEKDLCSVIKSVQKHPKDKILLLLSFCYVLNPSWKNIPTALDLLKLKLNDQPDSEEIGDQTKENEPRDEEDKEDFDTFTTLDDVITVQTIKSALDETSSLNKEKIYDLIESVIHLNTSKANSYFHLGFANAIFKDPLGLNMEGLNAERRAWYITGAVLGYIRNNDNDAVVAVLQDNIPITQELIERSNLPCGAKLLPHLYEPLFKRKCFSILNPLIENHIANLRIHNKLKLIFKISEDIRGLIQTGEFALADTFVGLLENTIENAETLELEEWSAEELNQQKNINLRRKGQVKQAKGNIKEARRIYDKIEASLLEPVMAANLMADQALALGGFKTLQAVLPLKDKENNFKPALSSLLKGSDLFKKSINDFKSEATNAHFCMGLVQLFSSNKPALAEEYFEEALAGMLKREKYYSKLGIIKWCEFFLTLCLFEDSKLTNKTKAENYLDKLLKSEESEDLKFSVWLWARLLFAAEANEAIDKTYIEDIASFLLPEKTDSLENVAKLIKEYDLFNIKPLRDTYIKWLIEGRHNSKKKWGLLSKLNFRCLESGYFDACENILDELESIASQDKTFSKQFCTLLDDPKNYDPAWSKTDALNAQVQMYEINKDFQSAAKLLTQLFYQLRTSKNPSKLMEAEDIVSHLDSTNQNHEEDVDGMRELIQHESDETLNEDEALMTSLKNGMNLSLIYIGGNETQKKYQEPITKWLKSKYPGVQVTFYFPGWDSGWNTHLSKVTPLVQSSNAVVLNYLMRTQFGRKLRKLCTEDYPWFPCTGKGKQSLTRAIEKAILYSAQQKTNKN